MECIILAGGLGTRLRTVCANRPKPMAPISGRPFLEYLMRYWGKEGASHFILSVGYKYEVIIDHFGSSFQGIPIDYVIEKEPLGTGGGLLFSLNALQNPSTPFLLLNGDTYFEISLTQLTKNGSLPCTLSLATVPDNSRYDGVKRESSGLITSLSAKETLINGGVYLFDPHALKNFPKKCSLEKEILPYFIKEKECFGHPFSGTFIDIGIPEDYHKSQNLF